MNFEMDTTNILETKSYELTYEEKVPVIKYFLGLEGLHLIQSLIHDQKEKCRTAKGLF